MYVRWIWLASAIAGLACSGGDAASRPPSAVLITLDTTRVDALGAYGAPSGITPALDRIASEGIVYEQARTVAPITLPAHASMLTGLYPPRHGTRDNGWSPLSGSAHTLAERARDAGLQTGAFVAAVVLDAAYGLDQGFDVYSGPVRKTGGTGAAIPSTRGLEVARQAVAWLRSLDPDRGFFLWVHLFDPHHPLEPPPRFLERTSGNRYLAEVAAADAAVGLIKQALDETGSLDDTLIAVVGDHGEGRGDHDESAHGVFCYDSTLRVPFLLRYGDGYAAGSRSDAIVSVVDVFSTLIEALGIAAADDVDGVSLYRRPAPGDRGAYFESYYGHLQFGWAPLVGWVDGAGKYLYATTSEYYEVAVDPAETHDIATGARRAGAYQAYRASIEAVLRAPSLPAESAVAADVSQQLEQLEQLGYVTSGESAPAALVLPDPLSDHGLADPRERRAEAEGFNQALTAVSRGELDRAIAVLRDLVAGNPENPSALHYLSAALLETGRCDESLPLLERLEASGRLRPTSLANFGTCLRTLGRTREAVAYFERALALDPGSRGARSGLESARRELEAAAPR